MTLTLGGIEDPVRVTNKQRFMLWHAAGALLFGVVKKKPIANGMPKHLPESLVHASRDTLNLSNPCAGKPATKRSTAAAKTRKKLPSK